MSISLKVLLFSPPGFPVGQIILHSSLVTMNTPPSRSTPFHQHANLQYYSLQHCIFMIRMMRCTMKGYIKAHSWVRRAALLPTHHYATLM
eukprot:2762111-Amphidinium_carterae.1